jgi:methionyl aminopeptidase
MTIETDQDLNGLKRIGRIVALTVREMQRQLKPGITTADLNDIGARFLEQHGARPAPGLTYDFPAATCISVNNEAAHGIPGERVIRSGDLVNIDVSAELDGYFADTGASMPVPPISALKRKLCNCARMARQKAIGAARAGRRLNEIGQAIETSARRCGFTVIRNVPGHGVGRGLHEEPSVPGFYLPSADQRLTEGLVITVEPFLATGARQVVTADDGWTLKTEDGSLAAQYEHTIVITRGRPIIITAL